MGNFKELRVWQAAKDLAVEVYQLTSEGSFEKDFGLRDQIRRAAVSVASNIAEGDELGTNKQSINYLFHARGSVAEVQTQLIIASAIGYISDHQLSDLETKCNSIGAMINALIRARR